MSDDKEGNGTEHSGQGNPLSGFGELDGVNEARTVQATEKTNLDKILEVELNLSRISVELDKTVEFDDLFDNNAFYDLFYNRLKNKELADIMFNETDIINFINTNANSDDGLKASVLLGLYSGVLLQLLTERNRAKGKRTRVHIDGNGRYFPYLFSFAKIVDELFVANFKGDQICHNIGSYNGNAEKVVLINIEGNDTAYCCGSEKGKIGSLVLLNTEGVDTARGVAFNGAADFVCVVGNKGKSAAKWSGSNNGNVDLIMVVDNLGDGACYEIADDGGRINQLIIACNTSNNTCFRMTHDKGYVGCAIINQNSGDNTLEGATLSKGTIDLAVVWDNVGKSVAKAAGEKGGTIKKLVVHERGQLDVRIRANGTLIKKRITDYYNKINCVYPVERMVSLCQSMKEQQHPDAVSRLASEVYALHTANYQHLKEFGVNVYAHGAGINEKEQTAK